MLGSVLKFSELRNHKIWSCEIAITSENANVYHHVYHHVYYAGRFSSSFLPMDRKGELILIQNESCCGPRSFSLVFSEFCFPRKPSTDSASGPNSTERKRLKNSRQTKIVNKSPANKFFYFQL